MDATPALPGPPAAQTECYSCGYDLAGLTQPTCPECGCELSAAALARWERRQRNRRRLKFWSIPVLQVLGLLGILSDKPLYAELLSAPLLISPVGAVLFGIGEFRRAKARWQVLPGVVLGFLIWLWWGLLLVIAAAFIGAVAHW